MSRTNLRKLLIAISVVSAVAGLALLGMACGNATEDNDIVTVMEECGTPPLTLKQVDSEKFQVDDAAGYQGTYGISTYPLDDADNPVTFSDDEYDEYWVLQDADNQVIAGLRRSYTANQDVRGVHLMGCLDASVRMAFSDAFLIPFLVTE